mmetsp:Transcript_60932/g.115129  ORF Transcript_60932/g.115129 Transcript_60932/m.115129 type:complete len:674 (+) Transcript_60932:46-2067(+)
MEQKSYNLEEAVSGDGLKLEPSPCRLQAEFVKPAWQNALAAVCGGLAVFALFHSGAIPIPPAALQNSSPSPAWFRQPALETSHLEALLSAQNITIEHPDPELLVWDSASSFGGETFLNGWLNVPLLHDPYITKYEESPRVCLRVRALPATQQPARSGPLLAHCGGPSSGRDCVAAFLDFFKFAGLNNSIREQYDLWSIDQRGVDPNRDMLEPEFPPCPFKHASGASVQPYPVAQCDEASKLSPEEVLKRIGASSDEGFLREVIQPIMRYSGPPVDSYHGLGFHNETFVRWFYRLMKLEHNLCFVAERFQLKSPLSNRSYNTFHYTGTVDLAYDIEVFRKAIGASKMSIKGASYGTAVGGVYATIFPQIIHRLILDGDIKPDPDVAAFAYAESLGLEAVWTGMADACDSTLLQSLPGEAICPAAPNVAQKLSEMMEDTSDPRLASAAFQTVFYSLFDIDAPQTPRVMAAIQELYSGKKSNVAKNIRSGRDFFMMAMQSSVLGLDMAGRLSEEGLIQWWRSTKEVSPIGVAWALNWAVGLGSWPALPRPMPPIGRDGVKPLVIGNLHDAQTPYKSAQSMRSAFPDGRLMTWQGYGHCLRMPHNATAILNRYEEEVKDGKPPTYTDEVGKLLCSKIAFDYLATGQLPKDGHTCKVAGPVKTTYTPTPMVAAAAEMI